MSQINGTPVQQLPDWASENNLYQFLVRDATQYAMFMLDPEGIVLS